MKKILQFLSVIFSILIIYTLLLNSQNIRRLYHLNNLFDAASIKENFQNMPQFFASVNVKRSEQTQEIQTQGIQIGSEAYKLPTTFNFDNFNVSSDYFLRYTNTSALLILKDNKLIYENYSFTEEILTEKNTNRYIAWSISKSFVSTLVGIAIQEGSINSVDDLVVTYVPELKNTGYEKVTIKQLLHMTSGVEFNEDYGDFFSDINIFSYYLALGLNTHDYIKTLKNNTHQGSHLYTSIDTEVLAMLIAKATGKPVSQYLSEKIWQPLGMEQDALWLSDAYAHEFAAGGLNANPRDYARFGLLISNQGTWNGKEIISKNWLDNIGKIENRVSAKDYEDYDYSYQWWIPKNTLQNEMLAIGVYDQYIYINRDKNIVIVKLSANPNYLDDNYISEAQSLNFFRTIADTL